MPSSRFRNKNLTIMRGLKKQNFLQIKWFIFVLNHCLNMFAQLTGGDRGLVII